MEKNEKNTVNWQFLPPNCIFSMDDRWHWGSPSIFSFLNPKKLVFGSKRENFENLKIFKSGSLLRLWCPYYASPRPGRCLCAERNSRRWFWVLNSLCTMSGSQDMGRQSFFRNFGKCNFYHLNPSWCVYITKMVLSGTNWSHMENNDHCCHFGGIWQENNLFWA